MISIIAKATFRYVFKGVSYWVHSNEVINIDPKIPERMDLLKFFLSPQSQSIRKFLYLDVEEAKKYISDKDIYTFDRNLERDYLEVPSSFLQPVQEALPNSFIKEVVEPIKVIEVKPESTTPKAEVIEESNKESEVVVEDSEDIKVYKESSELISKREELENTHWSKVKTLAESMDIVYTSKSETINKILEKEFIVQDPLDFI